MSLSLSRRSHESTALDLLARLLEFASSEFQHEDRPLLRAIIADGQRHLVTICQLLHGNRGRTAQDRAARAGRCREHLSAVRWNLGYLRERGALTPGVHRTIHSRIEAIERRLIATAGQGPSSNSSN